MSAQIRSPESGPFAAALARVRPLRGIEEAALIRAAASRGWPCRGILGCLVFTNPDEPWDRVIFSRRTMRWRELCGGAEAVGCISLAECFYGWSAENAVRRLARRRRFERRRNELRCMVAEVERIHCGEDLPGPAQRFVEETQKFIEGHSVVEWKTLRKARSEFVWTAIGHGQRLDALLDQAPPGAPAEFYQTYSAALEMTARPGSWDQTKLLELEELVSKAEAIASSLEALQIGAGAISATSYLWPDPKTLPPRQWLFGHWLLRGEVTAIIAPGGTGKSTIGCSIALSLASGKALLGKPLHRGPQGTWIFNLEDGPEELSRQVAAACLFHEVAPKDCGERLYLDSGLGGVDKLVDARLGG